MRVKLEDVCERGSSSLRQSDVEGRSGDYPIFGAAGYIGNVDFYHQERPYVAVVKDGAGIGRTTLLPAKSSVIGTMQYLLPKDNVLPEYLCYAVRYMHLEKYFSGATIPHIYFKDYKNEEFNLYDLEYQAEVVGVLGRIERIMEARQQELSSLDDLIKARFVEMFGENSSETVPLKECCMDVRGGGTPSMQHPEYYGGSVPFIKSGDVRGDTVMSGALWLSNKALSETTAKYVPTGSVLVVNRSAALLKEFRAAIAGQPVVINQDIKAFVPKPEFTSQYLLWAIKTQTQYILTKVTTVLTSHIDLKDLLDLRIVAASIECQNAFSSFVEQIDKSKSVIQKSLDETQLLFNSLMQKYFG